MPNIGDPMSSTIPTVGTSGTTYAEEINDFLEEVQDRLETPISASSILGADLDMANNPVLNAAYIQLYPQDNSPQTSSVYVSSGELYFTGPNGDVQITSQGDLNASGIGGIGGDYGSPNPALVDFDDGTKTYLFYDDNTTNAFAYIRGLGLEIAGASISIVRARLLWAGASSMTMTLPPALPAAQVLMQMDATGAISVSNSLASNQSITLSGTGNYKHGNKKIPGIAAPAHCSGTITTTLLGGTNPVWQVPAASTTRIPLYGLREGDSIVSVNLRAGLTSGATQPTTFSLHKQTDASSSAAVVTSQTGTFGAAGSTADVTLTVTTPTTISANGELYYLNIVCGASGVTLQSTTTTMNRP